MKTFFVDTNILLEDPTSVDLLSEGGKNQVWIPYSSILELDRLKKNPAKSHLVAAAVDRISEADCPARLFRRKDFRYSEDSSDNTILDDLRGFATSQSDCRPLVFITNDRLLRLRATEELGDLGVLTQDFRESRPFRSESETYTGILCGEPASGDPPPPKNCFWWKEGRLVSERSGKILDYENSLWKVQPRTPYQNALMELLLDPGLDVVSVQSGPGYGQLFFRTKTSSNNRNLGETCRRIPKNRGRDLSFSSNDHTNEKLISTSFFEESEFSYRNIDFEE